MSRKPELEQWEIDKLYKLVTGLVYKFGNLNRVEDAVKKAGLDMPDQRLISILLNHHRAGHRFLKNIVRFLDRPYDDLFADETTPVVYGDLEDWDSVAEEAKALIPSLIPADSAIYLVKTMPLPQRNVKLTPNAVAQLAQRLYREYPDNGKERAETDRIAREVKDKRRTLRSNSRVRTS